MSLWFTNMINVLSILNSLSSFFRSSFPPFFSFKKKAIINNWCFLLYATQGTLMVTNLLTQWFWNYNGKEDTCLFMTMKLEWIERGTLHSYWKVFVGKLCKIIFQLREFYNSLDIFFIVVITYHGNKPLEPRKLMEIFHGIYIGICTAGRGLVGVMVT